MEDFTNYDMNHSIGFIYSPGFRIGVAWSSLRRNMRLRTWGWWGRHVFRPDRSPHSFFGRIMQQLFRHFSEKIMTVAKIMPETQDSDTGSISRRDRISDRRRLCLPQPQFRSGVLERIVMSRKPREGIWEREPQLHSGICFIFY